MLLALLVQGIKPSLENSCVFLLLFRWSIFIHFFYKNNQACIYYLFIWCVGGEDYAAIWLLSVFIYFPKVLWVFYILVSRVQSLKVGIHFILHRYFTRLGTIYTQWEGLVVTHGWISRNVSTKHLGTECFFFGLLKTKLYTHDSCGVTQLLQASRKLLMPKVSTWGKWLGLFLYHPQSTIGRITWNHCWERSPMCEEVYPNVQK